MILHRFLYVSRLFLKSILQNFLRGCAPNPLNEGGFAPCTPGSATGCSRHRSFTPPVVHATGRSRDRSFTRPDVHATGRSRDRTFTCPDVYATGRVRTPSTRVFSKNVYRLKRDRSIAPRYTGRPA